MSLFLKYELAVGHEPTHLSFNHSKNEDWVIDPEQLDDITLSFKKSSTPITSGDNKGCLNSRFEIEALAPCYKDIALTRINSESGQVIETCILHFEVS